MDSLAFGHNFDAYETAQQQQQQNQIERLINEDRIDFSRRMTSLGKAGFIMSGTGGAVFLFRLIPALSFGGFLVRAIALGFLLKEAVFCDDDDDRADYQKILGLVSLGSIGAEWDAILAIGLAISDFFTLYGGSIITALILLAIALLLLIFKNGNNSTGGLSHDDD